MDNKLKCYQKEIKEDLLNGKTYYVHEQENNTVEMSEQPKVIYRFNTSSKKIPTAFLQKQRSQPQIQMRLEGSLNSQNNLGK